MRYVKDAGDGISEVLKEAVRVLYNSGYYDEGLGYLQITLFINPDEESLN